MTPDIAQLRSLLRAESDTLFAQLDRLSSDDWARPSPCAEWDVLDIVVHMQFGSMVYTRMVENALAGRMVSPWTVPEGITPHDYFRQLHRDAHAEGPATNLAHLRERLPRYIAHLDRLSDADLDRPAWFYGLPADLRKLISAFTNDLIVHATDIRRPVGLEPLFSPEGSHFTCQIGFQFLPLFITAERLAGAAGIVRHTVDGETTDVELGDWGARVIDLPLPLGEGRGEGRTSDATITTDGATWTLMLWRGLPLAETESRGTLRIDGDRALVERYLTAIKAP